MEQYIYDESNGLWYELNCDYYIPCFALPEVETKEIGIWGMRHLDYMKQHRKATYNRLSFEGKLNAYLCDINTQAEEIFSELVNQMSQTDGITEQLKAQNQMEWVRRMNNIRQIANEIIYKELIYVCVVLYQEKRLNPLLA